MTNGWKLLAALLLTIAVGVQVLEASGRWDKTIADANDEAGLVAIVLCIGLAIATAAATRAARSRPRLRVEVRTRHHAHPTCHPERGTSHLTTSRSPDSTPPAKLRI